MSRGPQSNLWLPRSRDEALYHPEPRLDGRGRCRFGLGLGLGLGMGCGGTPYWLRLARQLSSQIEAAVMSGGVEVGAAGLYAMVPGYTTYVVDTGHPSYPTTIYVQTWIDLLAGGVIPGVGWTGHVAHDLVQNADALEPFVNADGSLQFGASAYMLGANFIPASASHLLFAAGSGLGAGYLLYGLDGGWIGRIVGAQTVFNSAWAASGGSFPAGKQVSTIIQEASVGGAGTARLYAGDVQIGTGATVIAGASFTNALLCYNNLPVVYLCGYVRNAGSAAPAIRETVVQLSRVLYGTP